MHKYMRILVFFDLPVKTRTERKIATKFRNFLLKDGYYMLQYSVYVRLCNGVDSVNIHKQRLQMGIPNNGSIRVLTVTEKQYDAIDILLGEKIKYEKPVEYENLSFF